MGKLNFEQLNYLPMVTFLEISRPEIQIQVYLPPTAVFSTTVDCLLGYTMGFVFLPLSFLNITATSIILVFTIFHLYLTNSNLLVAIHYVKDHLWKLKFLRQNVMNNSSSSSNNNTLALSFVHIFLSPFFFLPVSPCDSPLQADYQTRVALVYVFCYFLSFLQLQETSSFSYYLYSTLHLFLSPSPRKITSNTFLSSSFTLSRNIS